MRYRLTALAQGTPALAPAGIFRLPIPLQLRFLLVGTTYPLIHVVIMSFVSVVLA